MPLIFSAITPHSPLLIPAIGKENYERLKNTLAAYKKLEEELYVARPDTIVIISPHGSVQTNTFTINLQPEFTINFEEFGDFVTKINLAGDIALAHKIRGQMEVKAPVQLVSENVLDYGSAVPLCLLTSHLPRVKIIPISYSGLDLEAHFKFGEMIKKELEINHERVAVIASGDLSHALSKDSPAGYSANGKKFDQKLTESLLTYNTEGILNMDSDLIHDAKECGLKSIVILLGILAGSTYEAQLLSYESPFGVGYLTMNFKI